MIDGSWKFYEIALRWLSLNHTGDLSIMTQAMAWCHWATNPYLNKCWSNSMSPCGFTRPWWVNSVPAELHYDQGIVIQILSKFHSALNQINFNQFITAKLYTCHDSTAVIPCTKICSDFIASILITTMWIRHCISIVSEKLIVKWTPGHLHKVSRHYNWNMS